MLKNKSTPGHIIFERDRMQNDSTLSHPGMVSDAVWLDVNKDGWEDLVVAGAFMPITVFINHLGVLHNETKVYGLSETNGWWCRILADDFDNDGDTDLVIGNLGTNTQFKASSTEPLTITYGDFFGNRTITPVLCYYNQGKSYPYYSKDEMADQFPSMQKKFLHYADYADARLSDIFTRDQLEKSHTVEIKIFNSVYLRNDGNKKFTISPLPRYAQVSAINGMVSGDIDKDGNKDIILAGNFYPLRVSLGPIDAGMGLVLRGNGKGNFTALPYAETGLNMQGDIRDMINIKAGSRTLFVAAKNSAPLQIVQLMR